MVTGLDDGLPVGHDDALVASHRADQHGGRRSQVHHAATHATEGEGGLHHLGAVLDGGQVLHLVDLEPVEDLLHGGGARRERGVDAHAREQPPVARAPDARDDLRDAQLLTQEGYEEVLGVVVRDGHHHVGVLGPLLLEKFEVGAVALEYEGVRQPLRQLLAALRVLFDDGQIGAPVRQLLRHHEAHVPTSDDEDPGRANVGREAPVQLPHALGDAHEHHAVSRLERGGASGDHERIALDGPHGEDPRRQRDLPEALAEEGIEGRHQELEQGDTAAGEPRAVDGPRRPHDVGYLVGEDPLRPQHAVDEQADGLEGTVTLEGVHVALPRDEGQRALGAQALRRQAGEDVDVVVGRARYESRGALHLGRAQIVGVGAVAAQELDVHGREGGLAFRNLIDDDDAVRAVQGPGDQRADLASTNDDDLHQAPILPGAVASASAGPSRQLPRSPPTPRATSPPAARAAGRRGGPRR